MLGLKEIRALLVENEQLMRIELQRLECDPYRTVGRLLELSLHRSVVKDMLIEALQSNTVLASESMDENLNRKVG